MQEFIITTRKELESIVIDSIRNVFLEAQNSRIEKPHVVQNGKYANVEEAAKHLKIAKQTLYGHTSKNEIPFFKRGKKLYFLYTDLDYWLESCRRPSKEEITNSIIIPK
jgi:excisionase family DNA binding protein